MVSRLPTARFLSGKMRGRIAGAVAPVSADPGRLGDDLDRREEEVEGGCIDASYPVLSGVSIRPPVCIPGGNFL